MGHVLDASVTDDDPPRHAERADRRSRVLTPALVGIDEDP